MCAHNSSLTATQVLDQARALRAERLASEPVAAIIKRFNEEAVHKIALLPPKHRLHIALTCAESISNSDLNVVRWGLSEAGWSNIVVTQDPDGAIAPRQIHIELSHERLAGMAWHPKQQEAF